MLNRNKMIKLIVGFIFVGVIAFNANSSAVDSLRVENLFADLDSFYIQYEERTFGEFIVDTSNTAIKKEYVKIESLFQEGNIDTFQLMNAIADTHKSWIARMVGMWIIRSASVNVLSQIGREILPVTTEHLELRRLSIAFLATDTTQEARDILFDISDESEFWFLIMETLAQRNDNRVFPLAIDSLQSIDFTRKIRAVMILADLGDPNAYQPLLSLYNELDSLRLQSDNIDTTEWFKDIEARIITTLGAIGNYNTLNFLIDKAQDESYYFSMNAIESLGELGSTDAVSILIEIMIQPNPEMNKVSVFKRLKCAKALNKIGDNRQEVLSAIEQAIDIVHQDCIEQGMEIYVEEQMLEAYNQLKK